MSKTQVTAPVNADEIADAFMQISEQFAFLANSFRGASAAVGSTAGSGKTAGAVRGASAKSAAKSAASAAQSAPADDPADDLTEDDLREALSSLAELKGRDALVSVLAAVDAGKFSEVDPDRYQELKSAIDAEMAKPDEESAARASATKKTASKPKGPALAEVQERFTELVSVDRDAAVALLKKYKVKKFGELPATTDTVKLMADVEAAFPEDADDDGLV